MTSETNLPLLASESMTSEITAAKGSGHLFVEVDRHAAPQTWRGITVRTLASPAFCSSGPAHNAHSIIRPSVLRPRRITAQAAREIIPGPSQGSKPRDDADMRGLRDRHRRSEVPRSDRLSSDATPSIWALACHSVCRRGRVRWLEAAA